MGDEDLCKLLQAHTNGTSNATLLIACSTSKFGNVLFQLSELSELLGNSIFTPSKLTLARFWGTTRRESVARCQKTTHFI